MTQNPYMGALPEEDQVLVCMWIKQTLLSGARLCSAVSGS